MLLLAQTVAPLGAKPVMKDTTKTNTTQWKDENVNISLRKLNSDLLYFPDTALHTFHRNVFLQPWYNDLGNLGSPAYNLLFSPDTRTGPALGYSCFDVYRYNVDSLKFYSTTRPYSIFGFQLGSKLEQSARIMHTQNIKPNWNFAVEYRKTTSPGFYKIQRNNDDNASFSTNYKSLNKHYQLFAGMVYNKEQHDENGGIVADTQLASKIYSDRRTVDVGYQSSQYSTLRSSVTNVLRDFTLLLQHTYTWGKTDTTYSEDSTQYAYQLKPRFSITHKMEVSTEKHTYKDLTPDSTRYINQFHHSFPNKGTGYYASNTDSVFSQQKWFWVDNKLLLNGYIGAEEKQLKFSAGLGNRFDQFISLPITIPVYDSLPKLFYTTSLDKNNSISNYLEGEIKKEALLPGAWAYGCSARYYITGPYSGNFAVNAAISRELKKIPAGIEIGFHQQLSTAPYSYTHFENRFARLFYNFNSESVSLLFATLENSRRRLSGGMKNYIINNYIYFNENQSPSQYTVPFNISQGWVRKVFKLGNFFIDNELVYQQIPGNTPVNVPVFMGRHQFSFERALFKNKLKMATGLEIKYNSKYNPAGYSAVLNRFYYQNTTSVGNVPVTAAFVNFRIKRFRAFIIGDNLLQLFSQGNNTVLYPGSPIINFNNNGETKTPIYASQDFVLRFGFSWPLVN